MYILGQAEAQCQDTILKLHQLQLSSQVYVQSTYWVRLLWEVLVYLIEYRVAIIMYTWFVINTSWGHWQSPMYTLSSLDLDLPYWTCMQAVSYSQLSDSWMPHWQTSVCTMLSLLFPYSLCPHQTWGQVVRKYLLVLQMFME